MPDGPERCDVCGNPMAWTHRGWWCRHGCDDLATRHQR